MTFSDDELELAQLLKAYGLQWQPSVGHYVLDQSKMIDCESPFQHGVYFILHLNRFIQQAGSVEELQQKMCWLPDWRQAREILASMDIDGDLLLARLGETKAFNSGNERLELYRLIEEQLTGVLP